MQIKNLRLAVQHASLLVLNFGGNFGVSLGSNLPCLSCPYVGNCGGRCYIHRIQSELSMPVAALFSPAGSAVWAGLITFALLIMLFGKSWCGWLCPFGLVQDWVTGIRRFFGIREAQFGKNTQLFLNYAKYLALAWVILPPLLATHVDLFRSFCRICPVRTVLPPFFNGFVFSDIWTIDFTNAMTFSLSLAIMFFSGSVVVGIFFKQRFFCYFCPMAAMMHILKPLTLLRLVKAHEPCHGCGTCHRKCTMGLDASYRERVKTEVQADGCCGCFGCVDTCASEGALKIKFGPWPIFSSSAPMRPGGPLCLKDSKKTL